MPIKPPNLDDRRYEDILAEAESLIPQYCPEWTNLGDADPGMTLVQLFSWMTELTIYRLNRVPDKTYIHFLNFIGEERNRAEPSVVPVTFALNTPGSIEVNPETAVSTRQQENSPALELVTVDGITLHDAGLQRVMAVVGGDSPAVREMPFNPLDGNRSVVTFAGGKGTQLFSLDGVDDGPDAYTPYQYLYIAHDDFRLMNLDPDASGSKGRLRIRRAGKDGLSIIPFFDWEYPTQTGWNSIALTEESEEQLGMRELSLVSDLTGIAPIDAMGMGDQVFDLPDSVAEQKWWIRGRLNYERWLANRMVDDLEVHWQDDRGGEERSLHNWRVRASGRTLEFFLQDLPPIRGGWTVKFAMVDRSLPAGLRGYLPQYRWYYRRGDGWEEIPTDRVRIEGTQIVVTGPLADMATDGFNLRAERVETAFIRGLAPDLELDLNWQRPVRISMMCGEDVRRLEKLPAEEGPWSPFQISPVLPPTIGRKFFVGSDVFENRNGSPVVIELEVGFEMNGDLIAEPADLYQLQLCYRAEDSWRVVYSRNKKWAKFTFADLDKDGAKREARRKIRIVVDPNKHLKDLSRHMLGDVETTWLRFELIKSSLSGQDDNKETHPIVPRIFGVEIGVDKTIGDDTYEEPLPGPRMAQLDYRERNRRLTRVVTQSTGRLNELYPFYGFVDIEQENQALYLEFSKPLPKGSHHTIQFRCRGEAFLPEGVDVEWEYLEKRRNGVGWQRLQMLHVDDDGRGGSYRFNRSGALEFVLPEAPDTTPDGFWLRGRFTLPEGVRLSQIPALPPVTHIMLNTVDAVNLHTVRTERYSGYGVPNQVVQLLRRPLFIHDEDEQSVFPRPDLFPDVVVRIKNDSDEQEEWMRVTPSGMLTANKDDAVYVVDAVEGTLTFGNGIRGRMAPVGSNNILVDLYRIVPGARGNIGPGEVVSCETLGDIVRVTNVLPASGGRDAESIEEIVRRAPTLLTSRDRAVTRSDFEVIAKQASGEVARAACTGEMGADGTVEVVVLPHRRSGENVPDPFLSAGLRDHVALHLKKRCLINVNPVVRLAQFRPVDISVSLRLRPNANVIHVRELAEVWVRAFLDPYEGGIDRTGWSFGGTLYAQDFARMVTDIPEVRHVSDVRLYGDLEQAVERPTAGWERGEGKDELQLDQEDLFHVIRVRIQTEDLTS
jgi:hypothetical protein